MAVYKVIQDIEAEDKLLGPLTLKGFIYALIAGTCAFIEFRLFLVGSPLKWLFIFIFAMPMVLFGVLASPLGRDQPTEVWLLSRIKYFLKPRRRTWDQLGMQELVTVTAPKKEERQLTKNLTQSEVQSRLKTLAMTLDTRGWAIKNVNVNLNEEPKSIVRPEAESDRLVSNTTLPREMPVVDVHPADDILDEQNNPTAQKFEAMMQKAADERRETVKTTIKNLVEPAAKSVKPAKRRAHKKSKASEEQLGDALAAKIQEEAEKDAELEERLASARANFTEEFDGEHKKVNPHHRLTGARARPTAVKTEAAAKTTPSTNPVTATNQAVNMELAQSGSAFSVATLSGLANRQPKIEQTGPNEVTISLH